MMWGMLVNRRRIRTRHGLPAPLLLACLALGAAAATAHAYTGGPVRATIEGFEPTENKLFYSLWFYDESDSAPQVYYFLLTGDKLLESIRARSLEPPEGQPWDGNLTVAWVNLRKRLVPLAALPEFQLELRVRADSTGTIERFRAARYQLHLSVLYGDRERTLDLEAFCEPLVRIRGVYGVPGRLEHLALLSIIGRPYGCEETDIPLLLPAEP